MTDGTSIILRLNGGGNPDAADDRYHENFNDGKLPHPEDVVGQHGAYELVGLYMRVAIQCAKINDYILHQPSNNMDEIARIGAIAEAVVGPMERWLDSAAEFLPEWFDVNGVALSYGGII